VQNGVLFVKNDEVPELRDAKNVAVPDYTAMSLSFYVIEPHHLHQACELL